MNELREQWDGVPKIVLTYEQHEQLCAFIPQWQGTAYGPPVPFGGGAHAKIEVSTIFRTTREEALEVLEMHVRATCESERMEYDEDQWRFTDLVLVNGC